MKRDTLLVSHEELGQTLCTVNNRGTRMEPCGTSLSMTLLRTETFLKSTLNGKGVPTKESQ